MGEDGKRGEVRGPPNANSWIRLCILINQQQFSRLINILFQIKAQKTEYTHVAENHAN